MKSDSFLWYESEPLCWPKLPMGKIRTSLGAIFPDHLTVRSENSNITGFIELHFFWSSKQNKWSFNNRQNRSNDNTINLFDRSNDYQ